MPVSPSGSRATCRPTAPDKVRNTVSASGSGMLPTKCTIGCRLRSALMLSSPLDPSAFDARQPGPIDAQRQNAAQQIGICEPVVQGGRGELLDLGDLGVGVGFDVIGDAVGGEPEIDAGVAVELERAVDALGDSLDGGAQLRREVLGRPDVDVVSLLVFAGRA